jgi:hypothetical protein
VTDNPELTTAALHEDPRIQALRDMCDDEDEAAGAQGLYSGALSTVDVRQILDNKHTHYPTTKQ